MCFSIKKDEYYILRIIFNDGKFENIIKFKGNQQDLEGIILFLNNKLNNKKTKNDDLLYNTPKKFEKYSNYFIFFK